MSKASNDFYILAKRIRHDYTQQLKLYAHELVNSLSDIGIDVARYNATGTFGSYITFTKTIKDYKSSSKVIIVARDSGTIPSEFMHEGEKVSVDISPLLMIEFGSGNYAINSDKVEGVGQGSLNTYGHAFQIEGWGWIDTDGKLHFSRGYRPHQPMQKAAMEMMLQIDYIAIELGERYLCGYRM